MGRSVVLRLNVTVNTCDEFFVSKVSNLQEVSFGLVMFVIASECLASSFKGAIRSGLSGSHLTFSSVASSLSLRQVPLVGVVELSSSIDDGGLSNLIPSLSSLGSSNGSSVSLLN